MPPSKISPSLLGSSHWITNDIAGLSKVMGGLNGPDGRHSEITPSQMPKMIQADSVFTSLAAGPKGSKIDSLVAGARLMGDKVKPSGSSAQELHKPATQVAQKLCFDIDELVSDIAFLNRQYDSKTVEMLTKIVDGDAEAREEVLPQEDPDKSFVVEDLDEDTKISNPMRLPLTSSELEAARVALDKVLLSDDFIRLAADDDKGETFRDQGGLVALANTTLGVMKMIREGTISADSPTINLINGQVYDVAKAGDMLKLAAATGSKVREMFVDETNLNLIQSEYKGNQADVLGRKIHELIEARREVTKKLDFSDLKASSEGEVDGLLKEARERLRSFRYDMDRHAGVKMSAGESFRRWADNFFRGKYYTVSQQAFGKIQALEAEIAGMLRGQEGLPAFNRSVETYKDAAQLSHRTNTLIRHCRSGYAAEQQNFAKEVHEIFDPLVKDGGKKTVYIEFGATARAGINVPNGLQLDVNGKVGYRHKVEIKVSRGGGQVTVTTLDGGVAEGGAKFGFGHNPSDWKPGQGKPGDLRWGANADVKGNLSASSARETTYPNLDEFIKAVGREDMIVREDAGQHTMGLNKIFAAAKWVARKFMDLPRMLNLIERRDVIDAKAIRDKFRTSGLLSNTDRLLTPPKHQHVISTQKKKYTLFEAGADGSVDAHLNALTGFKDDLSGEKEATTGSVLDLEAGIGAKYQREAFASGSLIRTRVSSLRLHSNAYLQHEIEAMKRQLPEDFAYLRDLQTQDDGNLAQLTKDLNAGLERLETLCEEYDSTKSDEDWRGVALALNLMACHLVRLENMVKAEIISAEDSLAKDPENAQLQEQLAKRQQELDDLKSFFEKRLTAPEIAIPEKIFEETMLDRVAAEKNQYSTYGGHLKFGYTVGTGLFKQAIKDESPDFLNSSKLTAKNLFANAAIENGIDTAGSMLGLSNKVDGHLSVKKAHESNDLRPWKHGRTMTLSLKFDSHMPMREVIDAFADHYLKSFDEADPKRPSKQEVVVGMISEFAIASGVGMLVQGTIGSSIGLPLQNAAMTETAPGPLLDFLSKPVVEATTGVLQYSGLDIGMSSSSQKTIEWQWYNGRLTNMSIHDEQSSSQKIGARFQVLPNMGVGVYLESGGSLDQITRIGYAKPPVDEILSRTEDLLGTGSSEPLKAFYAHNKKGLLRLYDIFRDAKVGALQDKYEAETDENVPKKYANDEKHYLQDRRSFLGHLSGLTKAFARIDKELSTRLQDPKKLDFADRVAVARESLLRAVKVMGDAHRTDAQKLNALRQLMTAIVEGYGMALEATEALGIKDLAFEGAVNISVPKVEDKVAVEVVVENKDNGVSRPALKGIETGVSSRTYFNPNDGQDYTFNEFAQNGGVVDEQGQNQCFFLSSLRFLSDPKVNLGQDGQKFLNANVDLNDSAHLREEMGKIVDLYLSQNKGKQPLDLIDGFAMDDLRESKAANIFDRNSIGMADVPTAVVLAHMLQRPVVMVTHVNGGTSFMKCTTDLLTNQKLPDIEPVYIHFANEHFQAMELSRKSNYQEPRPIDYLLQNFDATLNDGEGRTRAFFDRTITSHQPLVQGHEDEQALVRRLGEIAHDPALKTVLEDVLKGRLDGRLSEDEARSQLDAFLFGDLDRIREANATHIRVGSMHDIGVFYP